MPDFQGRAHERDVSFEEHAEQMLTLSAEHDEEIRSIKEEMLAEQDALLVENQRLQRAVADNEATKLSGSDLRSREREVHARADRHVAAAAVARHRDARRVDADGQRARDHMSEGAGGACTLFLVR